jgi:hypothetical protein
MSSDLMHAIVSVSEAKSQPYPYVLIEADGTARELRKDEREYLEEPFSPFDGARPYVKMNYQSLDGWGSLEGFLRRSEVPPSIAISEPRDIAP